MQTYFQSLEDYNNVVKAAGHDHNGFIANDTIPNQYTATCIYCGVQTILFYGEGKAAYDYERETSLFIPEAAKATCPDNPKVLAKSDPRLRRRYAALMALGACHEGLRWAMSQPKWFTFRQLYESCNRIDWVEWLTDTSNTDYEDDETPFRDSNGKYVYPVKGKVARHLTALLPLARTLLNTLEPQAHMNQEQRAWFGARYDHLTAMLNNVQDMLDGKAEPVYARGWLIDASNLPSGEQAFDIYGWYDASDAEQKFLMVARIVECAMEGEVYSLPSVEKNLRIPTKAPNGEDGTSLTAPLYTEEQAQKLVCDTHRTLNLYDTDYEESREDMIASTEERIFA